MTVFSRLLATVLIIATFTAKAEAPAFEIPHSFVHTLTSSDLGRSYDIYVKVPARYHNEENRQKYYPVIYLNDGPYTFQVASGVTHLPMNMGKLEQALAGC
ncbi:hypothetical protein [Gilvimarinus algae]|uniref:Esterase n=1 Tax=Gilvimarinus algae TaxID=3058037 RepID=A0ABT8TDC1_9GAMM|nr:hypothetical protein [Gilvimarinus sp. SDUM040014]MDO3381133.1 hypothetical protein [Gilvimarinus sp. SDUM040014]